LFCLLFSESRGICRYIAEKYEPQGYPFLLGKDALERASVEQWLHNEEHAFNPPSRALYCHLAFPLDEEDGDDIDRHTRKLEQVLEVYEQRLSDSRFLAGNKFTLADLVHLPNSHYITASDKFVYLYDTRKNVSRWWEEISTRKSWQQVLRDMKRVEEQNKQEELEKQQRQKEHPRTSGHPIRIYSRKQTSTEPRTVLVPPADTVSSSIVSPLPTDTFPDEALVSSSQTAPTADKTSATISKETTVLNAPDETPPTSVQSTPTISRKHPIPVQSIKDDSYTTAKKPPVADAAKSSTKDASIPEPTVKDLHSRHKPSSSKVVSNNLDVFDYYPSHTDEETPYIEPTPRRTSGTLDAFSGSSIGTGHTKTSSISAEEEPDQPSASDFYKNDSGATGIDSGYKESIPYSGHTLPKFEPADTSASKPHTTGGRRRLAEQRHTATTGLNDLKQDADHQMSTQQGKPTKDLKQYPPQDSEQATSHPVPEEPMSIKLVQRRENITLRPYTDQRSRGIVEDKAYSDQRSALPLPYTQEHDATPSRQESAKDARGRIPSQAGYPGGQDTNKQPRGPASVPRQRAAQDARGTFGESKAADSTISSESFPNATQSSLRRQDLDGARHTTTPFKKRYSGMEDTSKQAKDKISTPWQMVDKDTEDTTKDTKISDSSSSQVQPSHFQGTDAPSWKQEITEHRHSATSAIQERHADVEDTTGISRDIDFKIDQAIGQDDQDTFKETKSDGPSFLRNEQSDTWQAASTLPEQELNPDGRSEAPPAQRRYPSSTRPSKTRYQIAKDAIKQPRETAPTPKKKAAQDDSGTSEESNTAGEGASTKQPLNAWRAPSSPQIQEVKNSSRTNTSLPKRYPDDDEDLQVADTASASRQIEPDGDNDLSDETKPLASTTTSAKPLYTQQGALPLPRQVEVEDAQSKGRQSRVTIPEPQKIVARDARGTHGERKTATPEHKTRFDFSAEEPYRKDTIDDQKLVPPLLRKEPTSQVQPTSESLQEAASHGGSSTEPSIIEQWQRASVPLNDVTSSSGDDKIAMATIDQKLTPMSQQASPSVKGVNQMAKESGEQRVEQHVPTEAETSGVQSAPTSFPGASTAHHATTDDKFAKQSIIDERVGEQTKMQAPSPDFAPAHTKRATPDGHEISDPELVSTPDGQISEAAKTKHDQAILQEDVRDANLRTHNVAKDTFKEKKVVDSTPSSAKPMYTQQSAPTPRHAELEDTRDLGTKRRETVPEQQKMVERRAGTGGKQLPDRLKPIPPSTQATTEDALGAAGDLIRSPDILDTSKKSRGKYEEAKGPGLTLSEEKSLGAQDAQRTIGESITPTAGQRKDDSIKPQPDVQDGLKESKLSVSDWNGLGSLSSEGKDAVGTETTITGDKPERRRETTPPKTRPAYSQGLVKEQTSSIYQKKPLVAQDIQEQAQTIRVGAKAGGSTPKHQQPSDAPDIFYEKLNASEPARAKTHDDFSAEEPYGDVSSDDHKVAPPLLSGQLTSQVQPPLKPSHDATLHHIDEWQHASAPLHGQKPTLMKQQESGGERVEPPVPIEAEKSSVQHASSPFPGASVHDHATIGDKFAKQSITDERVEKPTQMQTSSPDAHPASESTERATREGHEIGDLELVSTPDGQILEATKARDDPATVHEDGHDVNLSTHDVGKDSFKETKVAESTPSSAKPMYTQQPAITPSRQTIVGEARDKSMQSRETIPEQQKMVGRKTGISGEQSSDRQKAIPSPRQVAAAEDAPTGDTIQSPYIPDISNESIGTFKEAIGPGSTLPKAQALDAQDSQLTRGESTMPTAEQRKGWKDANNDEEKSFSTKRLREMFPESKSSTQPTDSQGYSMVAKMSPLYQKGPLPAQESQEEAQIIQAGEKTPEHQESSGAPYTYDEKLSASAPARADIHDDHSAEEPYKKYTADDQKVTSSLSSKEPSSQVQPLSEPLQRAVPDGDMPSKSSTIAQWQRTSAPLYGVNTDSGDAEVAMSSNNDQKLRPSQEATLSPPEPELSRVGRTAPSVPEAARADDATANDKFPKQSNIDERVGSPKQMQQPIKTAHPASASTKRTTPDEADVLKHVRTPERHRLEAAKATQHPAKIHLDVHDASLSTHDAAIDEKTATYHANGDEPITGYVRDRQAQPPTSTQAQPTVETTHDPDSFQYVHTGDSRKIESGKPIVTDQEPKAPIPGSISMDPQREGTLPAEGGHSGQRSTLSGN
jgi:glutathione S-transferase